jgi:hypothetical protein
MYSLVLGDEQFSVPIGPLVMNCSLFQEQRTLIAEPNYRVQSRVSPASFRAFVSAVSGSDAEITSDNCVDLCLLSAEFKFLSLSAAVADWRAGHCPLDPDGHLITAAIGERLESQERAICTLDQRVDQLRKSALARIEQTLQVQQTAIANLQKQMKHERTKVAALKKTVKALQDQCQELSAELAESRRRAEQLEQENRGLGGVKCVKWQHFAPLATNLKAADWQGKEGEIQAPKGIIAHLSTECGGNVHDRSVVEVTSSQACDGCQAKNAVDLRERSYFYSVSRAKEEDIPHTRNNWICIDFKERRVVATHYAIRSYGGTPCHLKSWVVEASEDGQNWTQIDHREQDQELNGAKVLRTFRVTEARPCRFLRLVQIGRNHRGDDCLCVSAWEMFGSLLE